MNNCKKKIIAYYIHQNYKGKRIYLNYVMDNIIKDTLISTSTNKNSTNCSIIVNDYEFLQANKKIMGIIGILDASKPNFNLISECEDFQQKIRNDFPDAFGIKLFVFNFGESNKEHKEIVVLPRNQEVEPIIFSSIKTFCSKLLNSIENLVNRDVPVREFFFFFTNFFI